MRWVACFLGLLALTAGCVLEDTPVNPGGGGGGGGDSCGICDPTTPVCDEGTRTCVECTADEDDYCMDDTPFCDIDSSTCVACLDDSQCSDANAARCDTDTHECQPCDEHAQCVGIDGLPANDNACDEGVCVDCTPENEATTCADGKSCNPATRECTNTDIGSRDVCETCVADSECGEDGSPSEAFRCVEMFYPPGTRFPDAETGFCLQVFSIGGCTQPYAIRIADRESLSGDPIQSYCGINEALATCPAVRALDENVQCPGGEDEECPLNGVCRDVGGLADRCTYLCSDETQCDEPPNPGSTCGTSGAGGDPYCGG